MTDRLIDLIETVFQFAQCVGDLSKHVHVAFHLLPPRGGLQGFTDGIERFLLLVAQLLHSLFQHDEFLSNNMEFGPTVLIHTFCHSSHEFHSRYVIQR
jgi:hypothetical protein